ncbi:caspase family protein [Foetidibacter luteolus]|uniref:caspase family protein n=1 Tax=Foetidibacter luteolus TaxID=2608880 RepID=UPI00129A2455|nr:caspase family protein [Foetidibacter luteolus]
MPNKYALCIGINNYPGTGSDLSGCVNDANDWGDILAQRGFTVQKILDKSAKRQSMLTAIQAVIDKAHKGDSVVLQYSGHGSYVPDEDGDEPDGTDECLCPYDINTKGPITDDELFDIFSSKEKGVKLVMISDSCHSGTVARFAPGILAGPKEKNAQVRKVKFLPPATFLAPKEINKLGITRSQRRSSPPGRYGALLMAGCQDTEYSYDAYFNGRPNGAFSFAALATLKQLKPTATYGEWFKAIRKILPTQLYPQTPNLFGSASMKKWKVFA